MKAVEQFIHATTEHRLEVVEELVRSNLEQLGNCTMTVELGSSTIRCANILKIQDVSIIEAFVCSNLVVA